MSTRRRRFLVGILIGTLLAIADAARAADNLVFVPLQPCRVIDTRGLGAGGPLVAGAQRTFFFRGTDRDYSNQGGNANGCGIPDLADFGSTDENIAKAVAINIVAVSPGGPGNLRAWAANQAMPLASLVNYNSVNIANGVVVPMCDQVAAAPCTTGDITFLASVSGADLVVDVTGYFHAGSTGLRNTSLGQQALLSNTTGFSNTALGFRALHQNTTGFTNTANGDIALYSNTTGQRNTANGYAALRANTSGSYNTADGFRALYSNTAGLFNTAVGYGALFAVTGSNNLAVGPFAGADLTASGGNICIGNRGVAAESDTIRIGTSQTRAFLAGIRGVTTGSPTAMAVLIDSSGQLGTINSSREVKQDIAAVGNISERILGLRPVSFRYKEHAARGDTTPQFGLIAEEVEEVFPELVVHDARGRPETVKYHLLVPLLLNEVQRMERREEAAALKLQRLERRVEAAERRRDDGCAAPTVDARTQDGTEAPLRR